jgi:hypothetical protein
MKTPDDNALSWMVTTLAISYVVWIGYFLPRRVSTFARLFSGLGAELPLPTRVVIATCIPAVLWPVTLGAVAFLIVKELRIERLRTRVLISVIVFMATACASAVISEAIFQPMVSLLEQVR